MDQLSKQGSSLRRKSASAPWGPAGTKHRVYSEDDRALFFEAFARLGRITEAAGELGFNQATCRMWAQGGGQDAGVAYSAERKTEFFEVLDRTNNVAQAARSLGINVQTAFSWAYSTGAVLRKPRAELTARQQALAPQKSEFLKVLKRVGNISVASSRAGVKRSQGDSWARAAGIQNVPLLDGRREEFLRLLARGRSRKDAAELVGVNRKTAYRWAHAADTLAAARAAEPEIAELAYNGEVTTAFVEYPDLISIVEAVLEGPELPPAPGPRAMTLQDVERELDPRYLGAREREMIADLLRAGKSIRAIARTLERSPSTVSREIKRNSHPELGYQPHGAHRNAANARARPKESKLALPGRLRFYVKTALKKHWSPEQITHLLIKEFPDEPEMRVSHETIYQAIYLQARGGLKREVVEALRTGRTRRKKHKNPEERTSRFRDPMVNISERPAEVEDRAVPGHWEGDLITGAHNQSAIATLVERTTRFVMLVHLDGDHTAATVRDGLIKTMGTLPAQLRGSLTWDQGVEMARHKAFSLATDMDVYFCDPHSPWQRGSNENTNGLLRQYFPKGTDLSVHGPAELERVARELNERPRKTLGWNTPAEQLRDLLVAS
jgi:IS30 family transposase